MKVEVFRNFLTVPECQELCDQSDWRMNPSFVMNANGTGSVQDPIRSSYGASFVPDEFPLLTEVSKRAGYYTGSNSDRFETMQVLRYRDAQEYKPHFDYFLPQFPSSIAALDQGGQRDGTLIIYLETPDEGGATVFPNWGMELKPRRGDAIWFRYEPNDQDSLHGGMPVLSGTKRIATLWRRVSKFEGPARGLRVVDGVLSLQQCSNLMEHYKNRGNYENGVDQVIRFQTSEENEFIQPYVSIIANKMAWQFAEGMVPETVILGCMPPGSSMVNHADNVRYNDSAHEPNHTPNRTHTAVTFLQDGPGGAVIYGDNEGNSNKYETVVEQKLGRLHAHRCGKDYYHRVAQTYAPRHTFVVWFKKD